MLIVGAGQGGSALAFQLQRDRVPGVLVVDQAPRGLEGPWRTYARMPTLRSPKDFTGPDLGVPSLTYEIWHEAQYGAGTWQQLALIRTEDWADYLLFVRDVTQIEVANDTTVVAIEPRQNPALQGGAWVFQVTLATDGGERQLCVRKVVLASGQDGTGRWWAPDFVTALPTQYWAHAADAIDFPSLSGKRVAVLGAGASAADNAAMALEHGAHSVQMFVRRKQLQRVQPYRWISFTGFLRHLRDLDDTWRWRFMRQVLEMRESIPQATYDRMRQHDNFELHVDCGWTGVGVDDAVGTLRIDTSKGPFTADFVIAGTGMDVDFGLRPELSAITDHILTWSQAYSPPSGEENARLGRFPYLSSDGAYQESAAGAAPYLSSIFDFTIAATMSHGPSGASINAMTTAVPRLAAGITKALFTEDVQYHWQDFQAYDVSVFEPWGPDEGK